MKLFELQTDLTSFTYPVVKIISCLSVIILIFMRDHIFRFSNLWADVAVTVLCVLLFMASILCLCISIGELFIVYANLKTTNYQLSDATQLTIDAVTKLVSENDIVEIEVYTDNKPIKIGASAECDYSSSIFTNKLFYISNSEYETIERFTEALIELFPDGIIPVLKVDDLPLK